MALGYCRHCDTLRTISQGPQKWGTRECHWYPVSHYIFVHTSCECVVKVIDDAFCCNLCGPVLSDNVVERLCPGVKKSI